MPTDIAKWLLFYLHVLKTDALSPGFLLGGNLQDYPKETPAKQQLAVDMIYRCLKCGLIDITPEIWMQEAGSAEEFARKLARVDQLNDCHSGDGDNSDELVWIAPELYGTETGDALINRYYPGNLDLEDALSVANFNKEICEIFDDNGVPWTNETLIPLEF